ncbi:MAG: Phage tail tape measure protein [Frankiales bacterium]|nr:Phage tail tape measure protein [Frankiales bacterium]
MSNLKRLYVELATNVRPLVAGMAQGSVAVKRLGKDIGGLGVDMDRLSAKAADSSRRVVEATKRVEAAQARLNTVRASGKASAQQQASAEAALIASERTLARAHTQAADASKAASGGLNALEASGTRTRNILSRVALVGGAALAAGLYAGAHAAMELERSLYNVASISPQVAADTGRFRDVLLQMSTELPQSANELALGLYQIVSSGFQADDALTILDASARAASAGLSTTEVAATAISAVLKAYGRGAGSASDVSDVLFRTVQDGVITFEQLAQGVGDYIGIGATAKVSIGELGAAVAAMTLSGVTAAESGTSLNRVLQQIIKPSDALASSLHQIGYESGAQALATDGLYVVMEKLRGTTGGNVEELLRLFPEIRAARGAFALMANDGQNYTQSFDDIATVNGRVGATMQALEEQQKSAAYQTTILKNQAVALGIQLGQDLLPTIKFIVGGLHDFLGFLDAMPGPLQAAVTLLLALSAAAGLGGSAFIRFMPVIQQMRTRLAQVSTEGALLPRVLRGIGPAATIAGAALVIGTAIYGHYAAAKVKAKEATDDFVTALKAEAAGDREAVMNKTIARLSDAGDLTLLKRWGVDYTTFINGILGDDKAMLAAREQLWAKVNDSNDVRKLEDDLRNSRKAAESGRIQFAALAATQKSVAATSAALAGPFADLGQAAQAGASGTVELTDAQKGLRDTLAGIVDASEAAKTALTGLTDPQKVFTKAQQDANDAAQKAAEKHKAGTAAQNTKDLRAAQDRVRAVRNGTKMERQAAQDNLTQVRRHNQDRVSVLQKGNTDATVTLAQWVTGLKSSAKEQSTWEADLTTVARRAGVDVADALRGMGAGAIPIVHALATGTQTEVNQVKAALGSLAPSARQSLGAFVQELTKQMADQAAFVGNLIVLQSRGHVAIVEQLEKLPREQAVALAAQAARSSDSVLAPWESVLKRGASLAGDGTVAALASAVEEGTKLLADVAGKTGQQVVDSLVEHFGGLDKARMYLLNLRDAITDVAGRHEIDLVLNMLTTAYETRHGPRPVAGQQGHSRDSDFLPSGQTAAPPPPNLHADQKFADGGIREAQIRSGHGRGLFQWAEGSTGGEAFIPLGAHRRPQSARILHTVARKFGMAVVPTSGARSFAAGGATMSLHSGGPGVVRLDSGDVERVALALSRMVPRVHQRTFTGPIHGLTLAQVEEAADRAASMNALRGL